MKQITNLIYQIPLGAVNAFLIEEDGLTLIDTGYKNSMDKIFAAIKKGGKNPDATKRIILTHCHADHSGSAAAIKKKLNIPLFAHEEDAALLEQGLCIRMPMHLAPGFMNWLIYNLFIKRVDNSIESISVEEKLKDNDVLPIAGGVQVIHTPGHCAGQIALLVKNEGVLIAGDICAHVMGLDLSVVNEDQELSIKSILKVANLNFDKAVFGHGSLLQGSANKKLKEKFSSLQRL